jgi:SAM-dependent methyltransferase
MSEKHPSPALRGPGPVQAQTRRGPSLSQRLFARGYDWVFDRIDGHGSGEHRRRLAEGASGEVLEIGAGTGRNLTLYRNASRLVALEPDPGMLARAEQVVRRAAVPVEVVEGWAERLPFPDSSFDTVVASYVLCSVTEPDRVVAEARRVLRSGGTLRFYEHVRAGDARLSRWQDRLERPWGWLVRGCHPNRDTLGTISEAGLRVVEVDAFDFELMPPIVRPHVLGVAERPEVFDGAAGGRSDADGW